MKGNYAKTLAMCSAFSMLAACGGGSGSSSDHAAAEQKTSKINFDYELASVGADVGLADSRKLNIKGVSSRAFRTMTGNLNVAKSTDQSDFENFFWSSEIDEENFDIISTRTVILSPDDYDFRLTLEDDNKRYYGESIADQIIDGENNVDITLKPVIGDTIINTEYDNFCRYGFQYPANEFDNMAIPRIGVVIDSEDEIFFDINKETGASFEVLSALQEGDHSLEFTLYDGNTAVGRTTPSIIDLQVEDKCQDLEFDFEPYHGETILTLDLEASTADFIVNIPKAIVDEVQGDNKLENFSAFIQITGDINEYVEGEFEVYEDDTGDYQGTVTLEDMRFEDGGNAIDVTITFGDTGVTPAYMLGTCTFEHVLITGESTQLCTVAQLNSRRIISGNILGVLGLNVYYEGFDVAQGALITANGITIGQTGLDGVFGTDGYLKLLLKKGEYVIAATKDNYYNEKTVVIDPLDIDNEIILLLEDVTQGTASGAVRDAVTNDVIQDTLVTAKAGDTVVAELLTNAQGGFSMNLVPGMYTFEFTKDGYLPVVYSGVEIVDGQETILEAILSIEVEFEGLGNVGGTIINAVTGQPIEGVLVTFREGINNRTGDIYTEMQTDAVGFYGFSLEAGHYTAQLSKTGYADAFMTVISVGDEDRLTQNGTMTPDLALTDMRIVLSWAAEPHDLDSHLYGPREDGSEFHVYYGVKKDDFNNTSVELDRDDTNGYGPETITITSQFTGTYTYKVFDFSPRTESGIPNSQAKVTVYRGADIVAEFNAPAQPGTLWTVFKMEGDIITPINVVEADSPTLRDIANRDAEAGVLK